MISTISERKQTKIDVPQGYKVIPLAMAFLIIHIYIPDLPIINNKYGNQIIVLYSVLYVTTAGILELK